MKPLLFSLILLSLLPPLHSQTTPPPGPLTERELNGKKMLQQRCSICHLRQLPSDRMYGPPLNAGTVNGKEAAVRELILKGTPRMPGFQYGLASEQVDNIIAYLKTIEKTEAQK
jgi:mono/diheme cytochrome c family protein